MRPEQFDLPLQRPALAVEVHVAAHLGVPLHLQPAQLRPGRQLLELALAVGGLRAPLLLGQLPGRGGARGLQTSVLLPPELLSAALQELQVHQASPLVL